VHSENYTKLYRTLYQYKIEFRDLRSSGILCNVDWLLVNDVSGQPVGPIFKGQAVQDETDRLSRNVSDYDSTPRNTPEERWSHIHCGGSLK